MTERFCSNCGAEIYPGAANCPGCGKSAKKQWSTCAIVAVVAAIAVPFLFAIIGILAAILVPNFLRARAQGQYTACQSNCKNIGVALEMYATDNSGHYPGELKDLNPDYLRFIPTCPSAGANTYSKSYKSQSGSQEQGTKDAYYFYCKGSNHSAVGVAKNYPQYDSVRGLISRSSMGKISEFEEKETSTPPPGSEKTPGETMEKDSRGDPKHNTSVCQSNLKAISTALEMYSIDNGGKYPKSLKQSVPSYLKSIPTCPSAGEDTYSKSYEYFPPDKKKGTPTKFLIYCSGENHKDAGLQKNYPQYNSIEGLSRKPSKPVQLRPFR